MIQEIFNRKWLLYGLIFLCVTLYVAVFEVIPSAYRISELHNEIESVNEKLALIENAELQQEHLKGVLTSRGETYRSIFEGDQVTGTTKILSEIHERVGRSGITLGTLTPGQKIDHDQFSEWSIQITASGDFHRHAHFINELERSNLLVRFNQVRFESNALIPSDINAKYDFRVFYLTQGEERL